MKAFGSENPALVLVLEKKNVTHCALSGDLASKVTKLAGTLFVCQRFSTFWVEDRISYRYDSPRESRRKPEKSNKLPLCLFCRWKMLSAFVCIWKCTFHQCQNNLVIACGTEELQLQRHGTQLIDCWTKFQERGSLETNQSVNKCRFGEFFDKEPFVDFTVGLVKNSLQSHFCSCTFENFMCSSLNSVASTVEILSIFDQALICYKFLKHTP